MSMGTYDRAAFAAHPQSIEFEEWWRIWHFVTAFDARDEGPHVVWLNVGNGTRVWNIWAPRYQFEYRVADPQATGSFSVPLTVRAISCATDIVRSSMPTVLSLADDQSFMITCDDATVVFDMPAFQAPPVVLYDTPQCTAEVPAKRLADVLDVARTAPMGLDFPGYGPPLWCVIGDGKVKFHSDWSEYGHGRSTVSISATTTGSSAFHSSVSLVARALRDFTAVGDDESVIQFLVDAPGGYGCRVVGPDWTMSCSFLDPVGIEFGGPMRRELSFADIEFVRDGERAVEFVIDGARVRAHVHGGTFPICRLSTTIARSLDYSDFLIAELNQWNMSHAGMKFWWENNKVVAVIDLSCEHIGDVVSAARRLVTAATKLSPATSAL